MCPVVGLAGHLPMPAMSGRGKLTLTLASLAVLVALGLLIWRWSSHLSTIPDKDGLVSAQLMDGSRESGPNATDNVAIADESTPIDGKQVVRSQAALSESEAFERVICSLHDDDTACTRSVLASSSPEETKWLSQHGYPTEEQINAADALSTSALRDLAASGSLAYGALLGRRLLEEDAYVPGIGRLIDTARAGGIYALHVASDTYANVNGPQPDMVESLAYLRLAYLMGDRKAGNVSALRAEQFGVGPVELRMADERAAHLRQQMFPNMYVPPRP